VLTLLDDSSSTRNGNGTGSNGHKPSTASPRTEPRLSVAGDIALAGRYGQRWLIVDETHVRVFSFTGHETHSPLAIGRSGRNGTRRITLRASENAPAKVDGSAVVDLELRLSDIAEAKVDSLVGASMLVIRLKDGSMVEALRYTVGLAPRFSVAARLIDAYAKGEEPSEALTQDLDTQVCPKCGDPLPTDTKVCVKCVDKRAVLNRLLRYTIPYRWKAVLVTLLTFAGVGASLVSPIFQKTLTDDVLVPHQHQSWIGWIVLGVVGVNILSYAFNIWRGRVAAYISNHMVFTLRTQVYKRLQEQSVAYYDKRQTGSLLTRVTQDVNELQSFMVDGIQFFFVNTLQIVGTMAILLYFNWKLTLLVLLPIPLTVVLVRWTFKKLWGTLHRLWYLRSSLGGFIASTLSGVRVVKAFAQERRETDRFTAKAESLFNAGVVVEQAWATYFPILNFITTVGTYIIWYAGGLQVVANVTNSHSHGQMTIGVLMMFLSYVGMVMGPIQGMTRIADWLSRASASAERVFEVLDAEPDVANTAEPIPMSHIEGKVELRNVRFSYDKNKDVLEDVSVLVEPGEMIGLVGHSGAGKSTLINLLSRFYDVREGQILIDGVDIKQIDINDVRRQIGVVLQEPFLFPGTIADNIAYAKPSATPEQVMQAAKAANAHDFIMRFQDGYDTFVGERGVRLSGGERQRLSIARAILHDPRILILDEATASVDTETEKQIQEAIQRLIKGRTTFAIAHRLSTLRNADRLMVIEAGKLVELGTHDELLSKPDGVFKKLVDMQKEVNQLREV
jgi:ATP-binding cassette subfamily B protein